MSSCSTEVLINTLPIELMTNLIITYWGALCERRGNSSSYSITKGPVIEGHVEELLGERRI